MIFTSRLCPALAVCAALVSCGNAAEVEAERLCVEADALADDDPRAALEIQRRIWDQAPTSGTEGARRCLRSVREKLGRVRLLVVEDEGGEEETIAGCAWTADVMEIFEGSPSPPFRTHWAARLAGRCATVVGRAWTRDPDSPAHADLTTRLRRLAAAGKD